MWYPRFTKIPHNKTIYEEIETERKIGEENEGWTFEYQKSEEELLHAAVCYALTNTKGDGTICPWYWPWHWYRTAV